MRKEEFEKFKLNLNIEQFKEFYFSHDSKEVLNFFNLSYGNLRLLVKEFNLYIPKDEIVKKREKTKKEKNLKEKEKLIEKCSKNSFIKYYIDENHSLEETKEFFDLTNNQIIFLIKEYNCHKDKKLANKITKKILLQKYGNENYNNRDKAKQTCLKKYGVDNPYKSSDLMKNSFSIKEEKYGIGNSNNWIKNHETRIKNSGSLESSYKQCREKYRQTCLEKYGFDNPTKNEEIKNKISKSLENTFLDKYGSTCYWTTDNAIRSHGSIDSNPNKAFKKLLDDNNIEYDEKEFRLENRWYDIHIKDSNILIEIDPASTHNVTWNPYRENTIDKNYHKEKSELANKYGFRCIHVWDWDDPIKIINLLLKSREKIFARKCLIKEVSKEDSINFINTYHLQGYARDNIRIGLYYNDELVSIMTFGKPRYSNKYDIELIRYCSSKNVIGGAKKLFNYFINNYNYNNIVSYCDYNKFVGYIYKELGFTFIKKNISKHWYNIKTKEHILDSLLRQRGFDQLFGTNYGKGTSNYDLMIENGFIEIYDAGQMTFVLNRDKILVEK